MSDKLKKEDRKRWYRAGWSMTRAATAPNPGNNFLDLNNAMAYAESQGPDKTQMVQKQYIRQEWAEDLHDSRLRRKGSMER